MTSSKRQQFGLYGNFADGELDWGDKYNENWNRLSHLVHGSLNTATLQNAEPAQNLRVPGAAFLMNVAGALPSQFRQFANQIIVWDDGKWNGYPFFAGLIVHAKDTNSLWLYSGTAWQKMDIVNPEPYVPEAAAWYKSPQDSNYQTSSIFAGQSILVLSSSSSFVSSFSPSSSSPSPFNSNGTCRIPGLYQINAAITFDPPDNDQQIFTYWILKNNIRIASGTVTPDAAERLALTVNLSALDIILLNETILVYFSWQRGNITIQGGNGLTKLDILKVG